MVEQSYWTRISINGRRRPKGDKGPLLHRDKNVIDKNIETTDGCPQRKNETLEQNRIASKYLSYSEGSNTKAIGSYSHDEGGSTTASGYSSHAEGDSTKAIGPYSHAEGGSTTASSSCSHAEGSSTIASGCSSHAEGHVTIASGYCSHAEGGGTTASGHGSHAEGLCTNTDNKDGAHIMGKFGKATDPYSWFLANGNDIDHLDIVAKILGTGYACIDHTWISGGTAYAEMFETFDGQTIHPGYFITFVKESKKIRKANASDDYILGITSEISGVLGNAAELRWKNKFVTDEWGKVQYHEVVAPVVISEKRNIIVPQRTETQAIINSEYDNTKEYIPRSKRPEWVAVGLLGQILVRDDETCKVGGYCRPNDGGIATASSTGYRVIKRTGVNQILILYR